MKRITGIILAIITVLNLAGCSGDASESTPDGNSAPDGAASVLEGDIGGEITVSAYDTMSARSFLEDAAQRFEEKYPGTKVNVETFSAMPEIKTSEQDGMRTAMISIEEDPQAQQDYIDRVSTDLMRGAGADVLAMDVLPYYKYAQAGSLVDLSGYMEQDPDFNSDDYRMNIIDATRYGGGQYMLPLDYSFDYYAYDSTLLSSEAVSTLSAALTLEEMFNAAQPSLAAAVEAGVAAKMLGMEAYNGGRGSNLFDKLLSENMSRYVDLESKVASFDDGAFAQMLETVKAYEAAGFLRESMQDAVMGSGSNPGDAVEFSGGTVAFSGGRNRDERYVYKSQSSFSLYSHFNTQETSNVVFSTGSDSGNQDDDELLGLPSDSQGNIPFSYSQAYAVNSNSNNKRTAWEFIKFLLSEELQSGSSFSPASLPVNRAAWDTKAEWLVSGRMLGGATISFFDGGETPGGGAGRVPGADGNANPQEREFQFADPSQPVELTDEQRQILDNYTKQLAEYSALLNYCPVSDSTIESMIRSEVEGFFSGAKTASEVAGALQSKVGLYINE